MLGAIAGDIIGSVHEGSGTKTKDCPLLVGDSRLTDDTILTVTERLLGGRSYIDLFHDYFQRKPRPSRPCPTGKPTAQGAGNTTRTPGNTTAGCRTVELRLACVAHKKGTIMNKIRWLSAFALLALLGSLTPVWSQDKVLVRGDPPLTERFIDIERAYMEMLLNVRLTPKQRQEYQRLLLAEWKSKDKAYRTRWVKGNKEWGAVLASCSDYGRHYLRAFNQPKALEALAKSTDPRLRWAWALYESSSKPGSARNPVLVDGEPQLTLVVVDRYGDYLEIMLDLWVSGGLTTRQRQVLQDYLVKDWKKMTDKERAELLADVKRWEEDAGQSVEDAKKSIRALRPKLLARLQTTAERESSRWLLQTLAEERKKEALQREKQQRNFDAAVRIIRAGVGSWSFNQSTRRYDYRPDR
jgi:hypothetical protein